MLCEVWRLFIIIRISLAWGFVATITLLWDAWDVHKLKLVGDSMSMMVASEDSRCGGTVN